MKHAVRSLVATTAAAALLASGGVAQAAEPAARPSKSKVAVNWVSAVTVTSPVAITGVVTDKGKKKRRVVLQQRFADGWKKVARSKTASDGSFALALPTDWLYSAKTRVVVPRTRKNRAAGTKAQRIDVVPNYVPQGSPSSWNRLSKKYRYRFNPCQAIDYRINVAQGAPWAEQAIHAAVSTIAVATGMRFKYRGTTTAVPWGTKGTGKWNKGTELVVAFAPQSQTKSEITEKQGRGGPVRAVWGRDPKGRVAKIVRAGVVIDPVKPLSGIDAGIHVAIHEVGHAIGLGHTSDVSQQMNGTADSYNAPLQLGAGDLTGLRKLGRQAGCVRSARR